MILEEQHADNFIIQSEARERYRADGFKLVRVEPGAKQCYDEGWSGEGYTPDFGPDDGTGILGGSTRDGAWMLKPTCPRASQF